MLLLCYCVSFYASSAHLLDADSLKALCFQLVRPSVRACLRAYVRAWQRHSPTYIDFQFRYFCCV